MSLRRLQTIRHGLTTANLARVCGSPDDRLAAEGEEQASQARARLNGHDLGSVISSPMTRAVATAVAVSGVRRSALKIHDDCRERDFGSLSGLTHEQAVARFPEVEYLEVGGVQYSLNPPGGETLDQLRGRAARFLDAIHRAHAGEVATVFSHGNFLQQLRGVLLGADARGALELPLEGILNLALMGFDFDADGGVVDHDVTQLAFGEGVMGLY
jgi:broad specificity phosphatase PhoE